MNEVDTVLFDKTGTLTRERPEVGRVIAADGFAPDQILGYAAAAERKFHHPIALAILHKAKELDLALPPTDDTQYKVGYGITVHVDGHTIRVGSKRFMEMEGIELPARGARGPRRGAPRRLHDGHGGRRRPAGRGDRAPGGGPARGAGDHRRACGSGGSSTSRSSRATTRRRPGSSPNRWAWTATSPRCCPPTRPTTSRSSRRKGCKVCFVGDGINDSIALKKANVSISLRGASSIATDTAHIVFLEEGLAKLCELRDIARDLDRNVKRSWSMILAPNIACIAGVFTMGFGIMASVVTNNVAALAALGNGVLPLRKVAQIEAERRHRLEMTQSRAIERASAHSTSETLDRGADPHGEQRSGGCGVGMKYGRGRPVDPTESDEEAVPEALANSGPPEAT